MKCPGCGYLSFDSFETCKRCGAQMRAAAPSQRSAKKAPDTFQQTTQQLLFQEVGPPPAAEPGVRESRRRAKRRTGGRPEAPAHRAPRDGAADVGRVGFVNHEDDPPEPIVPSFTLGPDSSGQAPLPAAEAPGRELIVDNSGFGGGGSRVIYREDGVPERYWDPEIVGWGRRTLALFIDQALLTALFGAFFLGAYLALWLSGFDMDFFPTSAGLRATFLPFALLAALLSLIYHVSFQARTGQTPGQALAGIEIRTSEGSIPSGGRATLRWFAAALGLACACAGLLWAFFEPRRRGWADLLSKTTIAMRRRDGTEGARTPFER